MHICWSVLSDKPACVRRAAKYSFFNLNDNKLLHNSRIIYEKKVITLLYNINDPHVKAFEISEYKYKPYKPLCSVY